MIIAAIVLALVAVALFIVGRIMAGKGGAHRGAPRRSRLPSSKPTRRPSPPRSGPEASPSTWNRRDRRLRFASRGGIHRTKCVHYETKVIREYEESYVETSSDGIQPTGLAGVRRTCPRTPAAAPFTLDDGSGKIEVDPCGGGIPPRDDHVEVQPGEGARTIGSYVLNAVLAGSGGRRTIGYRFEEKCFPVGRQGYVFGDAGDAGGALRIRKGAERGKRLIVSLKSGEELLPLRQARRDLADRRRRRRAGRGGDLDRPRRAEALSVPDPESYPCFGKRRSFSISV